MSDAASFNLKIFRIFALHDGLIAILTLILIFYLLPAVGLFLFLIPAAEFLYLYFKSTPVSAETLSYLKKAFLYPGHYLIRNGGKQPSQAIALPIAKMICVSESDLTSARAHKNIEEQERAKCIIAHELGHLDQYDRLVFRWLQVSFFMFLSCATLLLLFVLIALLFDFGVKIKHLFYTFMLFVASYFLHTTVSRIVHLREYIADLSGYLRLGDVFSKFLAGESRLERKILSSDQIFRRINATTHPLFSDRLTMLTEIVPATMVHARLVSAQWLVCLVVIYMLLIPAFESYLELATLSFFILLIWPFLAICSLSQNQVLARRILDEYALGFLSAIIAGFLVQMLGNLIGFQIHGIMDSFGSGVSLIFTLLSVLGILYLASIVYFSFKANRQNHFLRTLKSAHPTGGQLSFWRGAIVIVMVHITFFSIGRFASQFFPLIYPKVMTLIVAEIIGYLVAFIVISRFGMVRLMYTKRLCPHWGRWRKYGFFVFSWVFVYYFSLHIVNGLRIPIFQPEFSSNLYQVDVFSYVLTVALATQPDLLLWFIICAIAREES